MLTHFVSRRGGADTEITCVARPGVSAEAQTEIGSALRCVPWDTLQHAYGAATDVPALLYAVTLGTYSVRREAWWELWGSVHHQGTVYEATVPSVPYLARIAGDLNHPDRVEALSFLRQVAISEGAFAPQSRTAVECHLEPLLKPRPGQPEFVLRALLLLFSAFPDHLARHPGLVDLLPQSLQTAWHDLAVAGGNPAALYDEAEDVMDRQDELEQWALAGLAESDGN